MTPAYRCEPIRRADRAEEQGNTGLSTEIPANVVAKVIERFQARLSAIPVFLSTASLAAPSETQASRDRRWRVLLSCRNPVPMNCRLPRRVG
jgi:hypothetical protein